jgi:hypothetical protein
MRITSISAGAGPRLHNSDGRQRFQRKRRKDILDGNTEALISAVESRCIRAIERARGGAGWFGFQQALYGILGTLFWRKTLRAAKKPQLIFWNKIATGSGWNLGHSLLRKTLRAAKKPQLIFRNKIATGSGWNLGHSLLRKTLRAVKEPQLSFWNKIATGSGWNLGHSLLAENFACGEKTAFDFVEQNFHRLSMESWTLCFGGKLKTLRAAKRNNRS